MSLSTPRTFTIMGATGNVGKAAALKLLTQGHHVRAVVPDINSADALDLKNQGATLVYSGATTEPTKIAGSLHFDKDCVCNAFDGVDGAFVLIPPAPFSSNPASEMEDYLQRLKPCIEKASSCKKFVFLSSCGAQHDSGAGNVLKTYLLEDMFAPLASSARPVVFIRPAYYYTNLTESLKSVHNGYLPHPLKKDTKIEMVSPDDVGIQVATQLADVTQQKAITVVELSGPRALTMGEISAIAGDIVGKHVTYNQTTPQALCGTYTSAGISPRAAQDLTDVIIGIENGSVDFEHKEQVVRGCTDIKKFLATELAIPGKA